MAQADLPTTASRGDGHHPSLARLAAEHTHAIRFGDIPADVVALAKTHLLDQLGVGLAAASLPRNRPLNALGGVFGAGGRSTALASRLLLQRRQQRCATAR